VRRLALLVLCAPLAAAAQDYRGDLVVLRDRYVRESRAFTEETRPAALELVASLEARAQSLAPADFLIGLARVTALADNGHDGWHPAEGAWLPDGRAPMRYFWFPDALVVARAAPEHQDLVGARIVALDGHAPDALFERLRGLAGGPDNYRLWNLNVFLERAELLHALGIARAPDRYTLTLRLPDGSAATREIAMVPHMRAPRGAEPGRLLSGAPFGNEPEFGWRGIADAPNEPLYLQDPDRLFRYVALPELGAAYVQFRAHYGSDEEPIEAFQARTAAKLAQEKPEHLVLDLRFDGGGDISKSVGFFPGLFAAVPGRIYVIVSRLTFSAGIVAAALVEMSAPGRVVIVGEPVGDRLRFWSEGHEVCLPVWKYCVHARDGLWDLVKGCAQEPGCYGDQFKAKVPDLDPDLAAPLTVEPWLAGTDPAMTAIRLDLWGCEACRPEPGDGG
jgi:hypothetical protein